MGSRFPLQLAHVLCFWLHGSEQVPARQAGQMYFGGLVRQIVQREERRGSAIVLAVRGDGADRIDANRVADPKRVAL